MLSLLALFAAGTPTLDRARTCEVHLALVVDDVARDSPEFLEATRQMASWWQARAVEADAPRDDSVALATRRVELERQKAATPHDFSVARGGCVDEALNGGAVPGMMLVQPG